MTKEERVNTALKAIKEELLKLMSDAEIEWEDYKKSGELKKSQVLKEIYSQFPFLATYIDQDTLVNKLYDKIPNKSINTRGMNLGKLDYQKMMHNVNIVCSKEEKCSLCGVKYSPSEIIRLQESGTGFSTHNKVVTNSFTPFFKY